MAVHIPVTAAANNLMSYLPLYNAMVARNWKKAKEYVGNGAVATAVITETSDTVLHVAIGLGAPKDFVRKLVNWPPAEALVGLTNSDGDTVLSVAAAVGNVDAARLLVERNRDLLFVPNNNGRLPLHMAALCGDRKIVQYLLSDVKDNANDQSYCLSVESRFHLSLLLIHAKFYDLVLKQVESYTELATMTIDGQSLLGVVAAAIHPSRSLVWTILLLVNVAYFVDLDKLKAQFQKSKARLALSILPKLVKFLCEKATELELSATVKILKPPLLLALENGNRVVVEGIVAAFPPALRFTDTQNHSVLHLALKHRRPSVFRLIYRMYECKPMITATFGVHGDNILHFAARLPPTHILKNYGSPAVQLLREVKCFEEVEKLVPPSYKSAKNNEGKTPRMLFQETHHKLLLEGEKYVKDVANACAVVAALIATIAFTSAIQVPGGADNNGTPVIHKQPVFVIFTITNGLSFLLSTSALFACIELQIFSCIDATWGDLLTRKLSKLFTLLVHSLFSMIISFGAAYYWLAFENSIVLLIPFILATTFVYFTSNNLLMSAFEYYTY